MMHKLSFVLAAFAVAQSSSVFCLQRNPTHSRSPDSQRDARCRAHHHYRGARRHHGRHRPEAHHHRAAAHDGPHRDGACDHCAPHHGHGRREACDDGQAGHDDAHALPDGGDARACYDDAYRAPHHDVLHDGSGHHPCYCICLSVAGWPRLSTEDGLLGWTLWLVRMVIIIESLICWWISGQHELYFGHITERLFGWSTVYGRFSEICVF
ncbi:hypothetical protein BC628DRAFT_1005095 [Trametes gibbosa]|nr:hypothetical protein BC628DRAFT_1005095 [Trametes gibbosa]